MSRIVIAVKKEPLTKTFSIKVTAEAMKMFQELINAGAKALGIEVIFEFEEDFV